MLLSVIYKTNKRKKGRKFETKIKIKRGWKYKNLREIISREINIRRSRIHITDIIFMWYICILTKPVNTGFFYLPIYL